MTHESTMVLPAAVQVDKALFAPGADAPVPVLRDTLPDSQQVRALEAVFADKDAESHTVAGLLGFWTGTMVLHDLAIETFSEPAGEVEPEEKPTKQDEPEEMV
jgi:hypothetical protein